MTAEKTIILTRRRVVW